MTDDGASGVFARFKNVGTFWGYNKAFSQRQVGLFRSVLSLPNQSCKRARNNWISRHCLLGGAYRSSSFSRGHLGLKSIWNDVFVVDLNALMSPATEVKRQDAAIPRDVRNPTRNYEI
jgi:hypothetical protein